MKATMKIDGMMCMHCVGRVSDALNALEGISANVVLEDNAAYLDISGDIDAALAVAKQAVTDAGYTVTNVALAGSAQTATLKIDGMMCMHCVGRVSDALNALDGVRANVVLDDKAAYLEISGDADAALAAAKQAVIDAGYTVTGMERG